jgi:hypothetical protein
MSQLIARLRHRSSADDGFSMFLVMMVLLTSAMFVAAGYAAARGDLPLSGHSKDRKVAFAAAEAGLNFYQFHLNQDNDYWLKCTDVEPPNATEPSPVNQEWKTGTTDPRKWRTIPGSQAQYTVELLEAPGTTKGCVKGDGLSMIDSADNNNVFRIRVTGRPSPVSPIRRAIISTFKRTGFLDFIYFTQYETLDPAAYSTVSAVNNANKYCANKPRLQRDATSSTFQCTEIQFMTGDAVNGPLHSNDTLLICGSPTFGRGDAAHKGKDRITVLKPASGGGTVKAPSCSNTPTWNTPLRLVTTGVDMPSSNDELLKLVEPAYLYRGTTYIHFDAASHPTQMRVTNANLNAGAPTWVATPDNGVVYVANGLDATTGAPAACTAQVPTAMNYTEATACANLYIDGTYAKSLTLASSKDIIIRPSTVASSSSASSNGDLLHSGDAVMGLVANNFVRVYHPCDTSNDKNKAGYMQNVTIDAAILTLKHSFIVDNHRCGDVMNKLTVNGAISQAYRGPVGSTDSNGSHGYIKDYEYDDRLKYRTPPHFLQPTSSSWNVWRFNEQVGGVVVRQG